MNDTQDSRAWQGPPHQGDESHLLRGLYRTSHAIFNKYLRLVGLPASKLALLRLLAIELPLGAGTMEFARRLGVNPAAISRLVKEMEGQKWVRCRTDPADGRRTHVSLTAKGQRVFSQLHKRAHEFERVISEKFSTQDIETTVKVLAEIRNIVEQLTSDDA